MNISFIQNSKTKKISFIIIVISLFSSCIISTYDDPCVISGKITDSGGNHLQYVNIISSANDDTIQTNADGKYQLNIPNGGIVYLTFTKEGYTAQDFSYTLLGGEHKVLNLNLNSLAEDAFLIVPAAELMISSAGIELSIPINTNTNYETECEALWIKPTKYPNSLIIKCDSNETYEERIATIIVKNEYEQRDSIKIVQLANTASRVKNL